MNVEGLHLTYLICNEIMQMIVACSVVIAAIITRQITFLVLTVSSLTALALLRIEVPDRVLPFVQMGFLVIHILVFIRLLERIPSRG